MIQFALAAAGLLLAVLPAAAQTSPATPTLDGPAAYRQQHLLGPDHATLVQPLLTYELANIARLVTNRVSLTTASFTFTLTNQATVAEVTGGAYTMTYYNALNQVLAVSKGRFGGLAPGASRNQTVSLRRPTDTDHTALVLSNLQAE